MGDSWRNDLGKIEYQARSRMNMSASDISNGLGVSQPTVTNFENGRSDISLSRFYMILNRFYMTPGEYFARVDDRTDFLSHFMREIRAANQTDDLAIYARLQNEVEKKYPRSHKSPGPVEMLKLAIKGMAASVTDPHYTFSLDDAFQIKEFMGLDGNWFEFEYAIFSLTGQFLPLKIALPIFKDMLAAYLAHPLYLYRATFNSIVFNFCASLIMDHNLAVATQLLDLVQNTGPKTSNDEFSRVIYILRQACIYLSKLPAANDALARVKIVEDGLSLFMPEESTRDLHLLGLLGIKLKTGYRNLS
ncbi:helix-turn-helix domain-containing protein [Schleiferilactobacillus shenzhenensis]|uniref:HTH cro/C1-type domain-containing protein n=1 Tax=Schleiferilactobacillus shenzhenensis LY-73 TaxID=1231336 RepID=U4TP49_9LACO|nr:helix-turn-helix transcriptional regulator [Schleiferilactobacillus shenzhenensis]ERL65999.1 hypothetical protein L248_2075 [Schleiferilactobacillus shenzhenensis LY-73]